MKSRYILILQSKIKMQTPNVENDIVADIELSEFEWEKIPHLEQKRVGVFFSFFFGLVRVILNSRFKQKFEEYVNPVRLVTLRYMKRMVAGEIILH